MNHQNDCLLPRLCIDAHAFDRYLNHDCSGFSETFKRLCRPKSRGSPHGMRNEMCLLNELALGRSSLHPWPLAEAELLQHRQQANDVIEIACEGASHYTACLLSPRCASRGQERFRERKCDHWVGDAASLGSGAAQASALRPGSAGRQQPLLGLPHVFLGPCLREAMLPEQEQPPLPDSRSRV